MSKELVPPSSKGSYLGDGVIEYVGHPSTRTRLHELHHKLQGHEPSTMSVEALVEREVDAESFAWEKMGKELGYRVGYPAYADLVVRFGIKPRRALSLVVRELRKRRVIVPREGLDWYMSRRISREVN